MSFCSPTKSFHFVFDPELFDKKVNFLPHSSDDFFSTARFENTLETQAHGSDAGPHDFNKNPHKSAISVIDEHPNLLDHETTPTAPLKGQFSGITSFSPNFKYNPLMFPYDINFGNFISGPHTASLNAKPGFSPMKMDFTPPNRKLNFHDDHFPHYESIENLTMKDFPPLNGFPEVPLEDPIDHLWNTNNLFKGPSNPTNHQNHGNGQTGGQVGLSKPTGAVNKTLDKNEKAKLSNSKSKTGGIEGKQLGQNTTIALKKEELQEAKQFIPTKFHDEAQMGKVQDSMDLFMVKRKNSKYSDDEDNRDDYGADAKGRSSKGLRVLSLKVKDIVREKKKATYKEVATALIKDLGGQTKPRSQETKDEQNIKRRVYDALNVLIATGILKKDGKQVSCDDSGVTTSLRPSFKEIKYKTDQVNHKITEIKRKKGDKLSALHDLLYKTLALKNLIKRNKEKEVQENLGHSTKTGTSQEDAGAHNTAESIKFPFLIIMSSTNENSMNLNMDYSQKQLLVESKYPLNVSGDVDVLLKMDLHKVSRKFFEEHIPKDILKHLPEDYVNGLN